MADNEKQFEQDIESFLISPKGGWQKATDAGYRTGFQCDSTGVFTENYALDIETLCTFVKNTQPVQWALFENAARVIHRRSFIRPFKMRLIWRAWSMSCATASNTAARSLGLSTSNRRRS